MKNKSNIAFIVKAGLIAAVYAVLTYAASLLGVAYGEIQFRFSEALTILPVFTPAAIPGLTIGCFIANLGSPFGMIDVICGTIATLLAAVFSWLLRDIRWHKMPILSALPPVIMNALIVGLEIAYFLPEGLTWAGFLAAALAVGAGELAVCLFLGIPLALLIQNRGWDKRLL